MYAENRDLDKRVIIPDIYSPVGNRGENRDIMPRIRTIAELWDNGFSPMSGTWKVYANSGEFILNI